jgi:hypothetical protein
LFIIPGQTADEVREAAWSQAQYERIVRGKEHDDISSSSVDPAPKLTDEEEDHKRELDELMFDTAM